MDHQKTIPIKEEEADCAPAEPGFLCHQTLTVGHQQNIQIKEEQADYAPDEPGFTFFGLPGLPIKPDPELELQVDSSENNPVECPLDISWPTDLIKEKPDLNLEAVDITNMQYVRPVYKLMHETNPDINLDARLAKNLIGYHNAAPAEGPETLLVQKGPEVIAITVIDPNAPVDCVKCCKMDKHAELKVKLKHDREKALALNEHKNHLERMRKKEDRKLSKISRAKLNSVNETVQNSSSFSQQSTRRIKVNTANSKENTSVRVSDRIKNRISNSAPTTQVAKSAPILEPEPLPSMSGICSSNLIVHENPVTAVVNSQSINRERKRRKLSNKQRELARLRVEKYRRNMTEEKKQQQKVKNNERYQKRKMMNIIKSISEMTEKEKSLKREEWRINSKRYYHNKKLKLQSEKLNGCTSKTISPQIKTARKTSKEERSMSL